MVGTSGAALTVSGLRHFFAGLWNKTSTSEPQWQQALDRLRPALGTRCAPLLASWTLGLNRELCVTRVCVCVCVCVCVYHAVLEAVASASGQFGCVPSRVNRLRRGSIDAS